MLVLAAYCANAENKRSKVDTSVYNKALLLEMEKLTKTSADTGFSIWLRHTRAVNKVMGNSYAELHVMNIIIQEDSNVMEANNKAHEGLKKYIIGNQAYYAKKTKDVKDPLPPDWDKLYDGIKGKYGRFYAGCITKWASTNYYQSRQLWQEYVHSLIGYYKAYPELFSISKLNSDAFAVFQYSQDKKELKIALKWIKTAIKGNQQPTWAITDTYANLLYKLNYKKEAIEQETSALSLTPDDQKKTITGTLDKMMSGEPTWLNTSP